MCRAFVTGSHAYGRPRPDSDLDLVVLIDPAQAEQLTLCADSSHLGSAGDASDVSLNFGPLNLICVSNADDYAWWAAGTRQLAREALSDWNRGQGARGVTRKHAIHVLEGLRREAVLARYREGQIGRADMAQVSLRLLVSVPITRAMWPADFTALADQLEKEPEDRSRWGVVADWLEENGEAELGTCFRYVFRKPGVLIYRSKDSRKEWCFDNLPPAVSAHYKGWESDRSTLAGLAATLWPALEAARNDL